MRDENNGQVARRTRNNNAEAHILAELEALTVRYVPMLTSAQLAAYQGQIRAAQTDGDRPSPASQPPGR